MKQKIEAPNYTQIPNIYFDEIMQILNQTENIVFLVIMRKTFGWHKKRDAISYSQIMSLSGIKSRSTISAALKGLQEKGLIETLKTGQLISYTVSINGLVQNIDQSKNCTGTSTNSVLVESKTSPNSVHTKEKNLNKDKEINNTNNKQYNKPDKKQQKENPYKEIYDTYISIHEKLKGNKPEIVYSITSKRISTLLKQGITKEQLIHVIKQAQYDDFLVKTTDFQIQAILSDNQVAKLVNTRPSYITQEVIPPKPKEYCSCGGEIKYGVCVLCRKENCTI